VAYIDKIKALTKSFYPTGRAFKMPYGGFFQKLHDGLAISEARAYSDAMSILDSILPDNDNFSVDDAASWERRLGLITNDAVSLTDRKAAITRKMNHPGGIKARQNYRYIQSQLRLAGFDVYVYENRFPDGFGGYVTQNPLVFSGGLGGDDVQLGDQQLGDFQLGPLFGELVVNSIYNSIDLDFNVGANLRSSFFIGGPTAGSFANVDADREIEFRQLILKLKPAETVAYLLITYI
jgi:hypothetical protein